MSKGTINKVILIGRLGSDPDVRYSANGMAIAKLSVATNERVPAGEGNWEDRTEWNRVTVFGKQAEFCGQYLAKGRLVYVEGGLRTSQWEDAQGAKRYSTEIIARDVQALGSSDEQGRQAQSGGASQGRSGGADFAGGRSGVDELPPRPKDPDDEIPF